MYTLRSINERRTEFNDFLGEHYEVIFRYLSPEDFRNLFEGIFKKKHVADLDPESDEETKNVYAFVRSGIDDSVYPLHNGIKYYIVNNNGKTFDNLTRR